MAGITIKSPPPLVEMRSITKKFLDVTANSSIDFKLYAGEICALLGENGAGKTTLMNILFGYYACDRGEILIRGRPMRFSCPRDSIGVGIGMIHQHFTLVPSQSVFENIITGTKGGFFLDASSALSDLMALQERFGLKVNPETKIRDLSVGERQKVEILKALYRQAEILIMDEPTAVLAPSETEELFKILRTLARQGSSIVFISHKLNEVMRISDRIVVLRNGRLVAERRTDRTDLRELANIMVGRDLLERLARQKWDAGFPVLEIENLSITGENDLPAVKDFSLTVREREIVGIAGVSGNGQKELAEMLYGLRARSGGTLKLKGRPLRQGSPVTAIERGMARIPEDRIEIGLLMDLSVEENLILEQHSRPGFQAMGMINRKNIHRFGEKLVSEYAIKTPSLDTQVKCLSGGNLQKIILARALSGQPLLIVASQPTRGLDVGAAEYVHGRILKEVQRGAAVILISEDLDEIFSLSDRIVVMYEGEIRGDIPIEKATRKRIGLWMCGVRD